MRHPKPEQSSPNESLSDRKRLFRDMQEHPENYTDQQLEAMMDDIDREQDADAAWQRFESVHHTMKQSSYRWLRMVAMFAGAVFLVGIAFATIHLVRNHPSQPAESKTVNIQPSSLDSQPDEATPVHFDNVQLDSILNVVAVHYAKAVCFQDDSLRCLKLIMTWEPNGSLNEFLNRLNAFDGLSVSVQNDTIVVSQVNEEEGNE